jgi:pimeloyl-ACP methyl ester carboxylesterase
MNHEEQYEEERRKPHRSSIIREEARGQFTFKWFRIDVSGREPIPGLFVHRPVEPHNRSLLFLHGFGGSKEDVVNFMEVAESLGFSMLAIDARGHGDRKSAFMGTPAQELLGYLGGSVVDNRIAIDMASRNGWVVVEEGELILRL